MNQNIEDTINRKERPVFRSEGKRRIAYFLDSNSIKYQYEPGVLVNSNHDKPRIWYPDFYLPEFGTYIEYYGLAGLRNYDNGIKKKESVYSQIGLDVISVYPWMLTENWQQYVMKELKRNTIRRYRNLMKKPCWSKYKQDKYNHFTHSLTTQRYHQGINKHY